MAKAKSPSLIHPVEAAFNKNYPALLPALKVALAVCIGLAFKEKTKPLSLILENPSGRGKSTVIESFFPVEAKAFAKMTDYVYRSDVFTPKSFVTNAANMTDAARQKIDLLPKLKNKYLLTKELAPIFRGQEKDLIEMFKILISILDGKGFMTNTGLASRGYSEAIVFNWLGATTPLPRKAFKTMNQLGTRLLFYETQVADFQEGDLIAYAKRNDVSDAAAKCNRAVNRFVIEFYKRHPHGSVSFNSVAISDPQYERIVKLANFLVKARAEVNRERENGNYKPVGVKASEGPHKIINYFKEIICALALIHERMAVNDDDMAQIRHIAISSTPNHLRPMIWELATKGEFTTKRGAELCQMSDTTISERYSKELELLGIIEPPNSQNGVLKIYKLAQSLAWIIK